MKCTLPLLHASKHRVDFSRLVGSKNTENDEDEVWLESIDEEKEARKEIDSLERFPSSTSISAALNHFVLVYEARRLGDSF